MPLPDCQELDGSPEFFSHKSLGWPPDGKYFSSLLAWAWGGCGDLKVEDCMAGGPPGDGSGHRGMEAAISSPFNFRAPGCPELSVRKGRGLSKGKGWRESKVCSHCRGM